MLKSKEEALIELNKDRADFIVAARSLLSKTSFPLDLAEDLVQDTFIKVSKYDDLHEKKSLKGYFFISLRSVIGNYVRDNRKKRNEVDYDDDLEKTIVESEYIDYDNEYEDFKKSMIKHLEDNEVYWFDVKVFEKYLESGLTYEEIAETTSLGVQTVYLSIKRCKEMLQSSFKEQYFEFLNLTDERTDI